MIVITAEMQRLFAFAFPLLEEETKHVNNGQQQETKQLQSIFAFATERSLRTYFEG